MSIGTYTVQGTCSPIEEQIRWDLKGDMQLQEKCLLYAELEKDFQGQEIALRLCEEDPVFFCNNFVMTYDPRKTPSEIPFVLYDFQEELMSELTQALMESRPLHITKSRDMGLSWVMCTFFVWCLLFKKGFSAGVGSRKEFEVDDGTMSSLFPKMDFILKRLPMWMSGGYNPKTDYIHNRLKIPWTESYIRGEAGDNIGRGGRSTVFFLDEFAHVQRSAKVLEAVSNNTDCLILGSTPNGRGNEHARIFFDKKIKTLMYKYNRHPDKTPEWFEQKKRLMTEEQIAQELLCSYAKSAKGRVYPQFDYEIHCVENLYDPDLPVEISMDFGIGDPTAVGFYQKTLTECRLIDYYESPDKTIDEIMREIFGRGYRISKLANGDPDGSKRDRISGHSVFSHLYNKYGIRFRTKRELVKNGIMAVRHALQQKYLVIDKKLRHFIDCIENYRYPDKEAGENEKPLHDWTSHGMDQLRYYIDYHYPIITAKRVTVENCR